MDRTVGVVLPSQRPEYADLDDERELIAAAQAGDREAFATLYRRHNSRLEEFLAYRLRRYGNSDRYLAEEIAAQTWLRAWVGLDKFCWTDRSMIAWLYTIGRNLIIDHEKSGRSRYEIANDPLTLIHHERIASAADRDETVLQILEQQAASEVHRVLQLLSIDQREVLEYRYLRGLSVEETAAAMGKQVGAIKALTYRGCRAMARHIDVGAVR